MAGETMATFQIASYSLFFPGCRGLWSKVVHFVGNRVAFEAQTTVSGGTAVILLRHQSYRGHRVKERR